jgi:hypothetical protein
MVLDQPRVRIVALPSRGASGCAAMLRRIRAAASVRRVTGKQRAVLSALRDAQHAHEGEPVSAGQIAALCGGPWHRRSDLVTQALWLLHAHGLVLPSAGAWGRGVRRRCGGGYGWGRGAAGALRVRWP